MDRDAFPKTAVRTVAAQRAQVRASSTPTALLWGGTGTRKATRAPLRDDDPAHNLIGRVLDDRYRVDGVLGRGGMGVVLEAMDLAIGRRVVVKVLAPRSTEANANARLMREAHLACHVQHPAIVTVFHLGLIDQREPYVVMERLDGRDLESLSTERGPLPLDTTVELLSPIADALDALHAGGVVHRDIKPANIFIQGGRLERGRAKLIDFGLAMVDSSTSERLTHTGYVLGTPEYISPECARGAPATPSSDVYALATSMYELLTGGRLPFDGNGIDLLIAKTRLDPKPLTTLVNEPWAEQVSNILARALSRKPELRPSAIELLAELRQIAEPVPLTRRTDRAHAVDLDTAPTQVMPVITVPVDEAPRESQIVATEGALRASRTTPVLAMMLVSTS